MSDMPPKDPNGRGSINPVITGVVCALLGAFGGCTLQFNHDMGGGHDGPVYILSGLAVGVAAGLIVAAVIREREG